MIDWNQRDRFETTVTGLLDGIGLRVTASVNCSDWHATAMVYARLPGADEMEITPMIERDSLDEALSAGREVAIDFVQSSRASPALQTAPIQTAPTVKYSQETNIRES